MDSNIPMRKEVKLFFIRLQEESLTKNEDNLKMAYQECEEADLSPKWVTAETLDHVPCTKNTVFVLAEFSGLVFEKLRSTKSVICGPMCIRSCLVDGVSIPENKSPVFTTAMRDVVVTASQLPPAVKTQIKEKVGFMGGVYTSNLSESVTHLVTDAVRSDKYERAAEIGIPAMRLEWVEAAWQQSQTQNMKATEPAFIAKYKCPIFHNMVVTTTNMSRGDKEEIKRLVKDNGGKYTAQMRQSDITLVVAGEAHGEKCRHARLWGVPVVKTSYMQDCVSRGYALPSMGYLLEPTALSSTPTKDKDNPNFTCNTESISVINFDSSKLALDETQATFCTLPASSQQRNRPSGSQHAQILEKINISDAKKAGSFLDGCKIFLSGFTSAEGEKLRRILSLGGATVFSELSDSVSHVLIGEFIVNDMKAVNDLTQRPHVVSVEWLEASRKLQAPASEEPYLCVNSRQVAPEPPSPLSQKGVQLLLPEQERESEAHKMPPPTEPHVNRKLFSDFLRENANSPAKTRDVANNNHTAVSASETSQESSVTEIFIGHKFAIAGFEDDVTAEIEEALKAAGGSVVASNFSGVADYAIVPTQTTGTNITAVEVVTNLWLEDCLDAGQVLQICYYHQPFSTVPQKKPLSDCCVSISNYFGKEKEYLIMLLGELGATYQDVFARVAKQEKGVSASTHLVCPRPEGQKYNASVRWGLPAIHNEWLLACARQGVLVPPDKYLIKDFTAAECEADQQTKAEEPSVAPQETPVRPSPKSGNRNSLKLFIPPNEPTTPFTNAPPTSNHGTPSTPFLPPNTPNPSASIPKPQRNCGTTSTPEPPSTHGSTPTSTPFPDRPHRSWGSTPTSTPFPNRPKRKNSLPSGDDHSPFHINTPDTPYGQVFETPTAESKKRWKRFIDDFPCKAKSPSPPRKPKRLSTPMSELKRRLYIAAGASPEDFHINYSIEKMDEAATNEENQMLTNGCEVVEPRRCSSGRPTPTASDFSRIADPSSNEKSPAKPRKSSSSEMASAMLGQLVQKLNTPKRTPDQPRPLPQRELVSPQEPTPSSSTKPVSTSLLPESQPILIGWDDPVEEAERAKALNTSTSACLPKFKSRKFVLSNVAEREKYEQHLMSVGETVVSTPGYQCDTTHLIMDKPVRSEKLLCCLASGKWVLRTSYIDHLLAHHQYLPVEEEFEWGGVKSAGQLQSLSSLEKQLAEAAIRWRRAGGGAFSGMRAVLVATGAKFESYERLILAGGGKILPLTLGSVERATHCFVESSRVNTMSVPLSEFVAHRVPCLPPIFLGEMLIKHPTPGVDSALIPEYHQLLRQQ